MLAMHCGPDVTKINWLPELETLKMPDAVVVSVPCDWLTELMAPVGMYGDLHHRKTNLAAP